MKIVSHIKGLFVIALVLLSFPLITSGEIPRFRLHPTLLKDRVPAGDLIPVMISLSIAHNHYVYKDQIKVESGDSAKFTITSTELPPGRIKWDQFLEKEVELYEERVEVKSFLQTSKNIPAGIHTIKLKVNYQGCSDKICFAPEMEKFMLPVHVEPASLSVTEKYTQQPQQRPEKKSQADIIKGIELSVIITLLAFSDRDASIQGKSRPAFSNELGFLTKSEINDKKVRGYPLSSRLKNLVANADISDNYIGVLKNTCCWWNYRNDGITIEIEEEWKSPLRKPEGCQMFDLRNGEIGLIKGEIFIREGTQLRLRDYPDEEYTFTKGRWLKNLSNHQ